MSEKKQGTMYLQYSGGINSTEGKQETCRVFWKEENGNKTEK